MSTSNPTPNPRRAIDLGRRCPKGSIDPSEATIEAWQNFTGNHAAYRLSMGEWAGPPHSRIEIKHSCGWALSLRPGLKSWAEVADAIRGHFGRLDAPAERPAAGSAVPAEGSGHPQPVEHRRADTRCDACWRGSCPGHPHPVTEPARTERDDRG